MRSVCVRLHDIEFEVSGDFPAKGEEPVFAPTVKVVGYDITDLLCDDVVDRLCDLAIQEANK